MSLTTALPYLPADDLMAIADAVQDEPQDDFDRWLAGEIARSTPAAGMTVDELARRRAGRSVQ
jgi:hypothetical protein